MLASMIDAMKHNDENFAEAFRRVTAEYKRDLEGLSERCTICQKDQRSLGPDTEMKRCSRCNRVGRVVWYCSKCATLLLTAWCCAYMLRFLVCRECQMVDWTNGRPICHKSICGKPPDVFAANAVTDSSFDDELPVPNPSFPQSPALVYQRKRLRENPTVLYFVSLL
jgi:hypothetical protein